MNESAVLASGLGLVESVRWHDDALWFADWTAGAIHRLDPISRVDQIVHRVDSLPLCFDFAADGRLVVLDSRQGWLLRGRVGSTLEPWVDVSAVGPAGNEVVATRDGGCFLNFANFDPRQGLPDRPVGRIAHVDRDGQVHVVAEHLAFPNGMGIADGGRTLVVAESHAARLSGFTIGSHGELTQRRTWAEVQGSAPDGISVDPDGVCWFADVPNQEVVGVAAGGTVHARLAADRGAFSCAVAPDSQVYGAVAHWPGGERMFDPSHTWDGSIVALGQSR